MSNKAPTTSATQIIFDRFYKGRPARIAELRQTRNELALGRKIRDLREHRGLSQHALARALGTKAPAISRIEDADYDRHSLRILRKIAEFFDQDLIVTFRPRHKRPGKQAA
jgi:DNA-binding XRE family transcriptional regulator